MQNNRGWLFKFFRDNNLKYYNSKIKTPAYLDLDKYFPDYLILEENWKEIKSKFIINKSNYDVLFLDEVQFMNTKETINVVEEFLNDGIDIVCSGLDQDSRGRPWETSSLLMGLADKVTKIYGFCNVCGLEATKTFRKIEGGSRTKVGSANIYEPRCLKHWEPR